MGVHHHHLARFKPTPFFDVGSLDLQGAGLGGENQHSVVGDGVTCRTETVAVEHSASIATVAEEEGGGTVPRLHQHAVVFIKRFQSVGDGVLVIEALRHHHCHGMWQRLAGHDQELQCVVERGTVAHTDLYHRVELLYFGEVWRGEHALAALHPLPVAADGVDLTVVGHHAERLCQVPCGKGVGTEAGVYHRHPACKVGMREIGEVAAQLV